MSTRKCFVIGSIAIAAAISLLAVSCEKPVNVSGKPVSFSASVSEHAFSSTKASYGTAASTATSQPIEWTAGDFLTVYCQQCNGAKVSDFQVSTVHPSGTASNSFAKVEASGAGLQWGTGQHTFYGLFPGVNVTGVTATISGKNITGSIPVSQGHGTVTGTDNKVVPPDMKNMFMVSKNVIDAGEAGDPVFLEFQPLSTALEFTIENGFEDTNSDMNITSISLVSAAHALSGGFCVDMDVNGLYNRPKTTLPSTLVIADNDSVAINFGSNPVSVGYGETLNFTFFLNPGNATEINDLTFIIKGTNDGTSTSFVRKARLEYKTGTGVTFATHKKTRIKGLMIPESVNFDIEGDIVIIPWETNLDHETTLNGIAMLEDGETIFSKIHWLLSNAGGDAYTDITSVKFVTNSTYTSTNEVQEPGYGEIFLKYDGHGELSFHTSHDKIYFGESCRSMFSFLGGLTDIEFGDNIDTSNATNMAAMFNYCASLTSLDLSNFDTKNVEYMDNMFSDCHSLTDIDLSSFDTSSAKSIGGMFSGCESLVKLDVSSFNTSNVEIMDNVFRECESLEEIDLSGFDTSNCKYFSGMFLDCSSLAELDVTNFDTSNALTMASMFYGCSSLTELDVTNFDTSNCEQMGYMFRSCSSLVDLDVTHFDTSSCKHMDGMFAVCTSLQSLDVTHFDTSNVESMDIMFASCYDLTDLDVTHFNTSNVKNMKNMFSFCKSLTELDVTHFDTSKDTTMFGMFQYCKSLTSLDVTHFDTSNVTTMWSMFEGCIGLSSLDVSNFDTSKVTIMSNMFDSCESLTDLDVSNFDTSNVINMMYMFSGCKNLESINLSGTKFDTSKVTNMLCMFSRCENLGSIDISHFKTAAVTNMGDLFYGCNKLASVDMSGNDFDTSNVTSMAAMFYKCYSLEELKTGNAFDLSNVTDNTMMFYAVASYLPSGTCIFTCSAATEAIIRAWGVDVSKFIFVRPA